MSPFVFQTCQGQPTIHSCLNLIKPLRNNPLTLILDENTATDRLTLPKDTSKQSEGICWNRNNDILIYRFLSPTINLSRVGFTFTAFFLLCLVKDAEPKAPKKGDTGKQSLICGHNEQTAVPHKESGTKTLTKSGKRINGEKSKDKKYV